MDKLLPLLYKLKGVGCSGIKISFEDEGALLNEIITMRYLTAKAGVDLSIKIGGCEAKRDIVDCMHIECDAIVAPMVESEFSLKKYLKSLKDYKYNKAKGFNLETIETYKNLSQLESLFNELDFVTFGRVDFVSSLNKNRDFVDTDEMYEMVSNVFKHVRKYHAKCYLGGAISISSKNFINNLINEELLDKFETRYIIYDTKQINMDNFNQLINLANEFEVEWLKYIHERYQTLANKDINRIKMIEERMQIK